MTVSLDSMYQQIILDHYKHPSTAACSDPFDAEVHHVNPTCGDEVTLRLRLEDGRVADLELGRRGVLDQPGLDLGDERAGRRRAGRRPRSSSPTASSS